jgi:hypothetical protein
MLIKEDQLQPQVNILEQLDQAVYLTQEEAKLKIEEVPIVEHNGSYLVDNYYLEKLSEQGVECLFQDIAEANGIDMNKMLNVVKEEDVISNPWLLFESSVVAPIKESSLEYQYVSECIDKWSATSDDSYLDAIVEDTYLNEFVDKIKDFYTKDFKNAKQSFDYSKTLYKRNINYINSIAKDKKNLNKTLSDNNATGAAKKAASNELARIKDHIKSNGEILRGHEKDTTKNVAKGAGKVALTGLAVYGGYKGLQKLVQTAKERPKSWIGKKIAALRNIYHKWMNAAEKTTDKTNSSLIKNAAHKILNVIDKLMAILQKHAG